MWKNIALLFPIIVVSAVLSFLSAASSPVERPLSADEQLAEGGGWGYTDCLPAGGGCYDDKKSCETSIDCQEGVNAERCYDDPVNKTCQTTEWYGYQCEPTLPGKCEGSENQQPYCNTSTHECLYANSNPTRRCTHAGGDRLYATCKN